MNYWFIMLDQLNCLPLQGIKLKIQFEFVFGMLLRLTRFDNGLKYGNMECFMTYKLFCYELLSFVPRVAW